MSGLVSNIRSAADDMAVLLRYQTEIRPDLAKAELVTTAGMMRALIGRGVDTPEAIHSYLENRSSRYDLSTIRFLLSQYAGSDIRSALWTKDEVGRYGKLF